MHSWSAVKLDLYGLKVYYEHVLRQPWVAPGLIKPPRSQRLPNIVTVAEARRIIAAPRVASYRVFFFTLYSLGLRLDEGLRLQVGDIDAVRARMHIRDAKGHKDRFVPLPHATHQALRRFWRLFNEKAMAKVFRAKMLAAIEAPCRRAIRGNGWRTANRWAAARRR
ncbi:MAG: hypothetical protein AMXMBFR6_10610 [Betaproteobacteria bacterium]